MDISLPGIDGIKTANIIKNRSEYRDVPVIALTAFVMKGDTGNNICFQSY